MELIKSFDIADIPETEYNLYTFVTAVVTHIYKEIYMKEKAVSLADRAYETIKTNILNLTYPPGMPLTELLELPVFRLIFILEGMRNIPTGLRRRWCCICGREITREHLIF